MTLSAAMIDAFIREVVESCRVWVIRDSVGLPTSTNSSGEIALPFWSKRSRTQKVVENVEAYCSFSPESLELSKFVEVWLPGMERDGLYVGLNRYGPKAIGYNLTPAQVLERLNCAPA